MAPTGQFTFDENSDARAVSPGVQGWFGSTSHPYIGDCPDFFVAIGGAMLRTCAAARTASPIFEERYTILNSSIRCLVTNSSNIDMEVWCYPWMARYDGINIPDLYDNADPLETGTGLAGTLAADVGTVGWTPFQSRYITESVKLLKPRKVHLQGGQSYTFKMSDPKPFYVTYGRFDALANQSFGAIAKRSRGMFFVYRGGTAIAPALADDSANWAPASAKILTSRTYRWAGTSQPNNYNDVVINGNTVAGYQIIQPQTGAAVTGQIVV